MTEPAISGFILFLISTGVLIAGLTTGEMPLNLVALDTKRETAPATFWALAISWIVFAVLGIAITVRNWDG